MSSKENIERGKKQGEEEGELNKKEERGNITEKKEER